MSSLLYANIRGLYLLSNKTKIKQIEDLLTIHNSVGIMLTESWLSDEILNAEINIPNFDIFRGDRCDRFRGGSAVYFR